MKTKIISLLMFFMIFFNSCGLEERTKTQVGIVLIAIIIILLVVISKIMIGVLKNFYNFFKNFFRL